jgi:16S rRNA (cytosine1402-N4)-methyltransferase
MGVNQNNQKIHTPVLLKESIKYLDIKSDGVYIDCTLGDGGYSCEIAKLLDTRKGLLISLDWDDEAIKFVKDYYEDLLRQKNWKIFKRNFAKLEAVLEKNQINKVNGAVFDLGLSSRQLDDPSRGFSFKFDSEIDMRMDNDMNVSADDLIKVAHQNQLEKIIGEYGEERFAGRIARVIKDWVSDNPSNKLSARELVDLIRRVVPASYRKGSSHPARRTFQALRIAVNDELNNLAVGVSSALSKLAKNGRLVVISYHSLEDRIVKNKFAKAVESGDYRAVEEGIIRASKKEVNENPRASSAKMRVIEKN